MSTAPEPQQKRPFRWGRIVLIASLGVNLIIVGLVAGVLLSPPDKGSKSTRHLDRLSMGLGAYIQALPEDSKNKVIEAAGGLKRVKYKETMRKFREGRRNVVRILSAKEFDAAALRTALENQRSVAIARSVALHNAFADEIAALTAEERAEFLETAKANRKKRGKKGWW